MYLFISGYKPLPLQCRLLSRQDVTKLLLSKHYYYRYDSAKMSVNITMLAIASTKTDADMNTIKRTVIKKCHYKHCKKRHIKVCMNGNTCKNKKRCEIKYA